MVVYFRVRLLIENLKPRETNQLKIVHRRRENAGQFLNDLAPSEFSRKVANQLKGKRANYKPAVFSLGEVTQLSALNFFVHVP